MSYSSPLAVKPTLFFPNCEGDAWEQTRSTTLGLIGTENQGLMRVDDTATYDLASEAKALQLKVVNKAATNIQIQEISSAGQKLDVPAGATATLGFLIRARQEPLKFKAFATKTGKEVLLNGQKILPIDVDSKGYTSIIVVHEKGTLHCFLTECFLCKNPSLHTLCCFVRLNVFKCKSINAYLCCSGFISTRIFWMEKEYLFSGTK